MDVRKFSIPEILFGHGSLNYAALCANRMGAEKVFLAYQVNGKPLPERHGFPLRLVADDHYGSRWVKYVERVKVLAI